MNAETEFGVSFNKLIKGRSRPRSNWTRWQIPGDPHFDFDYRGKVLYLLVETDNYRHYCGEMYVGYHGTFSVSRAIASQIEAELEIPASSKIVNFTFYISDVGDRIDQDNTDAVEENNRLIRLSGAPKIPRKSVIETVVFDRNPDVVAQVLYLAKGNCGHCLQPAPFNRSSDGTPYLEVHHIIPLAAGGEDTVENAIALCPNCHRKAHFG